MPEETPAGAPKPTPTRKRGPKPAADLDAVTRVGAEFRALPVESRNFAIGVLNANADLSRFALACADLKPEQRTLARAMCDALAK